MKKLSLFLLLLAAIPVAAQNSRYDAPFPSVSSTTSTPYLVANVPPKAPILAVCNSPANAVPCTNYATTYTSAGAACANGAQDTPQPQPSACQSTGDAQGNIGFWAPSGTYDYTVCITGTVSCFGPYTVTLGGASSAGITGATTNGGLVQTSNKLGLLTSCIAPQVEIFNNTAWVCGSQIPITTVAGLVSVLGKTNGSVAVITNGASGSDCIAGGGSSTALCLYNGSAWSAVSATAVPFSGLTSSTNAAGIFGVGGSLSSSSAGQVQGNQIILQSGLPQLVATASLTGGTLLNGRSFSIRYTLNTAAGETLPSVWVSGTNSSLGCSSGTTCSITVTAPTIPAGYTGYTIYSQDCGTFPCGGGTELRQIASAACVNITTNCVIGTAGTGAALPTANTAVLQPAGVTTNNCPDGVIPEVFLQRADGTYFGLAGVDSSTGNPLPTPDGTATICGRLFINDTGQSLLNSTEQGGGAIKTDLVSIAHKSGRLFQPSSAIDDRVISVRGSDVASGTDTFHQWLGYYGEQFVYNSNFQCNPIGSNGAGEDCIAAIRARSDLSVSTSAAVTGVIGIHGTASTDITSPILGSCFPCVIGVAGTADQEGVLNQNTVATYAGVSGYASANGTSNGIGVAFWAIPPSTRFNGQNIGLFVPAGYSNANDYGIRIDATSPNKFQGSNYLGAAAAFLANATQSLGVSGSFNLTGSLSTNQFAAPANISVTPNGVTGATTYVYSVCSVDGAGGTVCSVTNATASGNATLTSSNFNHVSINCAAANLPGATRLDVYRTVSGGTPSSTGKIGSITGVTDISSGCGTIFLDDKALAGDGSTLPTANSTGAVQAFKLNTLTNCAVNSASPAACGSASSGAVVIPTTTTTYTVNTTAVTTHSRILLTWLTFASDLPSAPTCVAPVATTTPTISNVAAGTSFTIALGSTTGQTCPQFEIFN